MSELKLCINCKHYVSTDPPACGITARISPVNGKRLMRACKTMRDGGGCGEQAALFEPIECSSESSCSESSCEDEGA